MKNDSPKMVSNATSSGKEKSKRKMPLKIVLRRLPSAMTWEQLETQLSPIPEFEFCEFIAAKSSGGGVSFSRVYFVFKDDDDVIAFKERFHGYVFVDNKGGESVGIVELAPNPKIPHDKLETSKERDFKCGTIETDHEYKKFMSERENPQKPDPISMEQLIKEIDEKEKMIEKNAVQETPLTQFMIKKSIRRIEEKKRSREEEKRERIERRYESELKDKQDRKDLKKVTEFRNSKFERSREGAMKEKERTKIRAYRSGDYNRNGTVEKSNKWSESNDRDNVHLSKKGTDPSASRDFLPKKAKQNGENQNLEVEKIDDSEKRKEARKDEAVTNKIIPNKQNIRVSKVINRTVAGKTASVEKNDKDLDKGKKEEKAENGSRPRRNKDRPERAIYQPSAVRRRAAALAASGAEKVASASKENP